MEFENELRPVHELEVRGIGLDVRSVGSESLGLRGVVEALEKPCQEILPPLGRRGAVVFDRVRYATEKIPDEDRFAEIAR